MGTEFINPVIILPKGDKVKLVIDARYLNSITDLSSYHWPLEPMDTLLTRVNGKIFTTSDMANAYHQVPLTEATSKLCSFVIGDKQWTYRKGFYGLAGLPHFFSRIMTMIFEPLIKKQNAITYIDDVLLQAKSNEEMFNVLEEYNELLKADPTKTFFFQEETDFSSHTISSRGRYITLVKTCRRPPKT